MEKTKKITILIAEDDKLILNALRDGLERAGFDVHVAHDGREALRLAKKICPSILLLDIAMPEKDGLEVLKEIRANEKTKNQHALIFSNLEDEKTINRARKLGVDEYLLKADFTIKDLITKIKEHCHDLKEVSFYYNI